MKEKQGEDIDPEEPHGQEHLSKSNTDDKEITEIGHSEEKDLKEETPILQFGVLVRSVKTNRCLRDKKDTNVTTDEGESSGHDKAEEDRTHASIAGGNSKSGESKETNTDDAHDAKEETKTEEKKQRGNERLIMKMKKTFLKICHR